MRVSVVLLFLVSFGLGAQSGVGQTGKPPATLYLIRHAEKPASKEDIHLTPVGLKRAARLPELFDPPAGSGRVALPKPDYIFATAQSKHSNRPFETVTPLGKALHLPVNNGYLEEDYPALAKLLLSGKYAGKVVLVAWHHGVLPQFAKEFGVTPPYEKWPDLQFDRIWRIDWPAGGGAPTIVDLPQGLMPGDSK
jgi:hypothetical protein